MKRHTAKTILLLLFALLLIGGGIATSKAAFIDFDRSTHYTDNTAIPAAKIPTIKYKAWYGTNQSNPATDGPTVTDNVTIEVPDPPAGSTWWYTVQPMLDNVWGSKAAAKPKTVPFKTPAVDRAGDQVRGVR
jgi:hypothetical protein